MTETGNPERFVVYLGYSSPPLHANQRFGNWGHKARITAEVRAEAGWRIRSANVGKAAFIRAFVVRRPATRRTRDAGNLWPLQKAVIDGVRDAGIVPDDDGRYLEELAPKLIEPEGRDRAGIWLVIDVVKR